MTVKDIATATSSSSIISQEYSADTPEEFQLLRDDVKVAEKEALQASQKRERLLESLRTSVNKVQVDNWETVGAECVRLLRDGVAFDVEVIAKRLRKELEAAKGKGKLSQNGELLAKEFFEKVDRFIAKKTLLERAERTIESTSETSADENIDASAQAFRSKILEKAEKTIASVREHLTDENIHATGQAREREKEREIEKGSEEPPLRDTKLVRLTRLLRNDTVRVMIDLLISYKRLEDNIRGDIEEEKRNRLFFDTCIAFLDEENKEKLIRELQRCSRNATIEKRISLYRTVVEKLVTHEAVAAKIHALARRKALQCLKEEEFRKAVDELLYAINLWKDEPETYRLLAVAFTRQKYELGAFAALREILRLQPDDLPLRKRIAAQWNKLGNKEQAIIEYKEILSRSPEEDDVRRELGKILYEHGSFEQCREVLGEYVTRFSEDAECMKWIGISWEGGEDWSRAISYLKKAVRGMADDSEAVQALSFAYRKLKMYNEAIVLVEAYLKKQPDSVVSLILLGVTYKECGEWGKAEKAYLQAIDRCPATGSLLLALGQVQAAVGKVDVAIDSLEEALRLGGERRKILVELGKALRSKGLYDRAEAVLKTAIEMDESDEDIWQELAAVYMEEGRWDQADAAMRKIAASSEGGK